MTKYLFIGLWFLSIFNGYTQNILSSENNAVRDYFNESMEQAVIYNGKEPLPYASHITNHPYLKKSNFVEGLLVYDGILYPKILIRLDTYREELIILVPDFSFNVILQPDKLNYVKFNDYKVIYLSSNVVKNIIPEGYYQLLYSGECSVFRRETCSLIETRKEKEISGSFRQSVRYYIIKDGIYYSVKSKKSILKVFDSHKQELTRYIRQHSLNFKDSLEKSIVEIVKQYELLNHQP